MCVILCELVRVCRAVCSLSQALEIAIFQMCDIIPMTSSSTSVHIESATLLHLQRLGLAKQSLNDMKNSTQLENATKNVDRFT